MESNFPKKTKKYKLNDRVICVSQKAPAMFMKLGKVMYYGYANNSKEKLVGVEFDKNVKVRDDVRKYFEARIGWGAFCNIKDLRKVTDENFDIESYKELVLQGLPEESTREIPKPKQQLSKKTPKGDNEITFEDEEEGDIEESTIQEEPEKVEEVPEKKPKKKEDKPKKKEDKGKKTKPKGTKTPKNKSETVTPKPPASPKKKPAEDEAKLFEKKLEPKVTIEDNIIPVEPEPVPTPVLETTQQKTPFEIKSSEEFVKLEDENRNYYKKMQQLELQVTELILANNQLKTDYSEKSKEYEFLKENYKELKEGATDADTDLTQLREELSALKVQKEMFEEKSITLETELEKYKDYDSFKSKFEEMSVNYESIKIEREDLEKKLKDSEEHASVLKEELELIELEIDVAAREEDIPDNIDELKKNYAMIQSAFQKVDLDLEVQKEEYEEKIQSLNDEIASLKTSYKDVMSSDEVSNAMKKKDDEIKDLKELIDQYTNANKMVEQLSESCQTKEEEINRLNLELEKAVDNLKSYQDENELLDDIIKECEATIEESDVTRAELEGRIDNLKEEYQQLEEKLVKYKNKLEDVNQERDEFEMQSSTLETEKEQFDNFYQEYNKTVQDKQAKIKEKMTFMIHAKECYWDSLKWRLYFKAVPEAIKTDLHLEYFDKYKEMSNISDKIDIILENLILYYLFKESVKLDNLNLYNISNELVIYLIQYQGYLNLLKIRYLECKTQEEYKELSSHILYREVVRNYSKINEVYNQLRDNEFSTKISYSDIVESNIRLAEEIDESEFHEHKNLSFKVTITAIMGKLVQCYITEYTQKKTKDVIDKLMTKLIYANDLVFEMDVDDKDLEKMKSFLSDMPGNVVDFKLWFDLYYKEIDDHYLEQHQQLERLNDGIWLQISDDLLFLTIFSHYNLACASH